MGFVEVFDIITALARKAVMPSYINVSTTGKMLSEAHPVDTDRFEYIMLAGISLQLLIQQ